MNFEGKIYVGLKLTPSVQAALGVVELGVELSVGAEGVGTRVLTTTDLKESDHRCRWCIDGTINGKVEIAVEIETGFWKGFKRTVSAKLLDYEKKLFDFYVSSELGFGKGDCPNLQTVPEQPVTPYQRMDVNYKEEAKTANHTCSAATECILMRMSAAAEMSNRNVKYIGGFYCCDITELTIPSSAEYVSGFLDCPIKKLTIQPPKKASYDQGLLELPDREPDDPCRRQIDLKLHAAEKSRCADRRAAFAAVFQKSGGGHLRYSADLSRTRNCCNSCQNLKKVNFTPTVTNIGKEAHSRSGVESVTDPGTVKKDRTKAFRLPEPARDRHPRGR